MPTTSRIIRKLPSFARAWNEEANEYQLLKQYSPSYIAADKSINEKANSIIDPEEEGTKSIRCDTFNAPILGISSSPFSASISLPVSPAFWTHRLIRLQFWSLTVFSLLHPLIPPSFHFRIRRTRCLVSFLRSSALAIVGNTLVSGQ